MIRTLTLALRAAFCAVTLLIAMVAVLSTPSRANPTLLIKELSDTDLTVTLDGVSYGSVNNVGPNHWEWRSNLIGNEFGFTGNPGTIDFDFSTVGVLWSEPSDAAKANFVGLAAYDYSGGSYGEVNMGLVIYSDVSFGSWLEPNANGAVGYWNFNGKLNTVPVFGPFDVIFSDQDRSARVPDGAATMTLLAISFAGLAALARRRR